MTGATPTQPHLPDVPPGGVVLDAAPVNATRRPLLRRWLQGALMVVGFGTCAIVLAAAVGLQNGVQGALIGLLFAVLPLGVVVPAFLWLDRFEAEPTGLLLFAFGWGALVASVGALVLNTSSMLLLQDLAVDPLTVGSVVVAPVVEEALKGAVVLLVLLRRRREFDGVVDGMVYAGICAAGFAFAENVLYLGRALAEGGGTALAEVLFLRGVISPFAHPLFTVCTGIGLGIAATSRTVAVRIVAPVVGLLLAMVLHGMWNLSTVAGLGGFTTAYLFLQVPIFASLVALAVGIRRREGHLIGLHLMPYADAGWLSRNEVAMLASTAHRRHARGWARLNSGRRGRRAMEAFQDAASELALLRMRMARGTAEPSAPQTERELLAALVAGRRQFIGTDAF